jgi:thiol-disulfide isomerase/thioredoxin
MTIFRANQRKAFMKIFTPIGIIILVVLGALYTIKIELTRNDRSEDRAHIQVGKILPDFSLTPLQGAAARLSQIKSKIVMVNFWATWCDACMVEMPSIVKLRDKYQNRGFEVLGINLDENPDTVAPRAVQEFKIDFPIFKDPEGKVADLFDVHAIPLTVILDEQRKILLVKDGEQDWNSPAFQSQLERWL